MNAQNNSSREHIRPTTSKITFKNRRDHLLARWAFNRMGHRVEPGLYSLGHPTADSHVFVSGNYTLSFDALRANLTRLDCYILVLDTKGINVWCAAGGGLFGTDELVNRIETNRLPEIVKNHVLILPQLSASGVAAHEVKKRTGFRVKYGPVRAQDLPEYLKARKATKEMRTVSFALYDRLILTGVEIAHAVIPLVILGVIMFFISGLLAAAATVAAIFAGVVLLPLLLPWLPTPNFSTKGFLLGGIVVFPFVLLKYLGAADAEFLWRAGSILTYLLIFPSLTAFIALNFTGSTTFASRSGVKSEIFTYFPAMAWMFCSGIVITIALALIRLFTSS